MGVEVQFVLIKQSKNRRRPVLLLQCAIDSSPFLSRTRLMVFIALAFIFLMNISYEYELEINVIEQTGVEVQFVLIKQSKNRRRPVLFRQCAINSGPFLSRTRLMVFVTLAFIFLSLLSLILVLVFCPCLSLFIIFVVPWFWRGTNGSKDKVIGILGSGSSLGFTFASRNFRQFFQSTRLPTQKGTFLVAALNTK